MSSCRIRVENICPGVKVRTRPLKKLAQTVLSAEGILEAEINIVLVNDLYITKLNQEFLKKGVTTDVLSFNLTDAGDDRLEGEVYANLEQIERQAKDYAVSGEAELARIVIHGVLHLVGFNDSTTEEKKRMTEKEDYYLSNFSNGL